MSRKLTTAICETAYIRGAKVDVVALQYAQGGLAIELVDTITHEPYARVSVWTKLTCALKPNQFLCKSYAENEGIDVWLLKTGICIDPNLPLITTGFVTSRILQLNSELSTKLEKHTTRKEAQNA
jgi:hypothetical protein